MYQGKYVFAQLIEFLPRKFFQRLVMKYQGDKYVKTFSCWNQLLVMMFGQLSNCNSIRDLTAIIGAHSSKSYHLGFGIKPVSRSNLAKANEERSCKIFEEYAYRMVEIAQQRRINKEFELEGKFYAFDSTTINLCLNVFWWAQFREHKAGVKLHVMYDVNTDIPNFFHITNAKTHDVNAMDEIPYEIGAYYIFDRGYFDLKRLYKINTLEAYFIIREKARLQYKVVCDMPIESGNYNTIILKDQLIIVTAPMTSKKYPKTLRRIVYYAPELNKTFVYITNNIKLNAEQIALLYKYRWQIELFFKWIKQHLRIKSFWGTTENAVRIQIYTAITAYCLVAIVEHDLKLDRSIYDVLRILGASLLDKTPIRELFRKHSDDISDEFDKQLSLNFF